MSCVEFIKPSVEVITEPDPFKRIELCGRVCYKSEDRITSNSAFGFVTARIKSGHTSILEHARVKVPWKYYTTCTAKAWSDKPFTDPYGLSDRVEELPGSYAIMNVRDYVNTKGSLELLKTFDNSNDYITVRFICDRAVANELVRHRTMSFSQESTRYVNYTKKPPQIIMPPWLCDEQAVQEFKLSCTQSIESYNRLINSGWTAQQARGVLPMALKTELIMTGTKVHWMAVRALRYTKTAHPQCCQLFELLEECPDFKL